MEEHLPYEITLMRESYKLALIPKPWAEHNSFIVAFLNSSRNLIEFFKNKPSCDFDPRMFTRSTYQIEKRFLRDTILTEVNNQISHLTSKRTKVLNEKLGEKLWAELNANLESEISRFEKALTDEYKRIWKLPQSFAISTSNVSGQSSSPTSTVTVTTDSRTDCLIAGPTGPSGPQR
ncbi:hypothetical protein S58_48800 [Bradyrhizobium oligotrophicum S58]|uniref:Uncharacterized protein n=2 Tax=Bradyrhizobium oligotrophicum TaxID=44255 RepID=M4ZAS7_9BRAD|nr:hypothetical protein S58_48800 [Bradyrhizobium oligotrophicum S58]